MTRPHFPQQPGPHDPRRPWPGPHAQPSAGWPAGPAGQRPGPYGPPPGGQRFYPRYDQYDEPTVQTVQTGNSFAATGEPEPPRRRGFRRKIIGGVLTLVLLAAGGIAAYVYYNKEVKDAPAGASEGSCVKVNNASPTDADIQTIDCADPAALFKVGIRQTGPICPAEGDYTTYTETTTGAGRAPRNFTLCLVLNVKEGECLSGLDSPDKLARVDCAGAEAKVVKAVEGTADENACGEQTTALTYPKPPTTYCLGEPAA